MEFWPGFFAGAMGMLVMEALLIWAFYRLTKGFDPS